MFVHVGLSTHCSRMDENSSQTSHIRFYLRRLILNAPSVLVSEFKPSVLLTEANVFAKLHEKKIT